MTSTVQAQAETIATYDAYARVFDQEFEHHLAVYNTDHAERFLAAVGPEGEILDLASGPGNCAAFFVGRGYRVLCGDLSEAMVDLCRLKGLRAERMDLETFSLDRRFDGIWANACLLHLPKASIPSTLDRIAAHLLPRGIFACSVKEGGGEGMVSDPEYRGAERYFSYFKDPEFLELLAPRFEILNTDRTPTRTGKTVFLKYLTRLRDA